MKPFVGPISLFCSAQSCTIRQIGTEAPVSMAQFCTIGQSKDYFSREISFCTDTSETGFCGDVSRPNATVLKSGTQ